MLINLLYYFFLSGKKTQEKELNPPWRFGDAELLFVEDFAGQVSKVLLEYFGHLVIPNNVLQ